MSVVVFLWNQTEISEVLDDLSMLIVTVLFFLSILQEIERALPSAPSPDPKHQLRRTSSAPLWWLHCKLVPTKLPCTPIILVCNIYVWHSSFQHLENYFSLGSAAIYSPQQCPLVRVFPICTFYKPHFQPTNHYKYALV